MISNNSLSQRETRRTLTNTLTAIVLLILAILHAGCDSPPQKKLPDASNKNIESAKEQIYRNLDGILSQDRYELQHGLRFNKIIRGNPRKKQVALTFDDGPHPAFTLKLLEILKRYNAKATFFLVGEMAEKYPELVKAELAAGHGIGNHTYRHLNLTKIPEIDIAVEIKACGEAIKSASGVSPHLFRPPGGEYNQRVGEILTALGYVLVLWTDAPGDYASPGQKILETRLFNGINNGSIILIHDGVQQTVDALPKLLQYIKDKGYEAVTIDEMLKNREKNR